MNGVDRVDQRRSTNATVQQEKRLNMSIFTMMIDLAINNVYAIYQELEKDQRLTFSQFKHKIGWKLVQQYKAPNPPIDAIVPTVTTDIRCIDSVYVLLLNKPNKNGNPMSVACRLCLNLDSTKAVGPSIHACLAEQDFMWNVLLCTITEIC